MLPESIFQVFLLIILLRRLEEILQQLVLVGEGVSVHDARVVNIVCPYLP